MSNDTRPRTGSARLRTIFVHLVVICLSVSALATLALKLYLLSPYPARQLSTLLSAYLHQPATVQTVHASGPTLSLIGVSIADPSGFPGGRLLQARSLAIRPDYGQLLRGGRAFRLIELNGLQIDLHQNSAGIWNFSGLKKLFAKPSAEETIIQRLSVHDSAVTVNGRSVREISLTVRDLATKGSHDARIDLTFRDGARNRYALKGTGRGGSDAAFDLTLKGESLSLAELPGLEKLKARDYLKQARGNLQVAATLHKEQLLLRGGLGFRQIGAVRHSGPLSGRLEFSGSYRQDRDQARLERLDLLVADLPRLHATGTLSGLKSERTFELALTAGDLDLEHVSPFLPSAQGRELALSGRLVNTTLHLAGSGTGGITGIEGGTQLRDMSLSTGGRLWISGLSGAVTARKQATGILLAGELSCPDSTRAALESIEAPFTLLVSPHLKPVTARLNLVHARLLGWGLNGKAGYDRSAATPFNTTLRGSCADLATVNPLLTPSGLKFGSGTGTATLQASGKDPLNFEAALDLTVSGLTGSRGQTPVALGQGSASARISRSSGHLTVAGISEARGGVVAGASGQVRLGYRVAGRQLTLEKSSITWNRSTLNLARLTAAIPSAEKRAGDRYYPLAIEFSGADVTHGTTSAHGMSGRIDGHLVTSAAERWLEGSATVGSGELGWQGKPVAAPRAEVTFDRSGARATMGGTILGGSLAGDGACNPFRLNEGGTFRLGIKGIDLAQAAALLPPRSGATIREGLLDGSLAGSYSGKAGLNARVDATGKGVTVTGKGKALVSGAGISLSGTIAGQRISIVEAVATVGDGIRLTVNGTVDNAFSPRREGRVNLVAAQAPFNSYIDALINSMPRVVQEATVDGSLAATGTLDLHNGQQLLQGAVLLSRIRLDSPGGTLSIQDLDGTFPFSLNLAGGGTAHLPTSVEFSRENFPRMYELLSRLPENSRTINIGRIALGKMELGPVTLHVRASNGLTEIVSLKAPFYEGTVLGRGSLVMKKGGSYRGDLLLSGMSLKELCSRFPAIKGYISGRVNGIVSLTGEGGGIPGMYGFIDFWAHESGGEKMLVSRDFLQRLGGKKLSGIFFRQDIPYDRAEISALLEEGYLTFDTLDIDHTNMFGVRDLNVSIAPTQNRIALDHLIESIKQASVSGKGAAGKGKPGEAAPATEFKWEE